MKFFSENDTDLEHESGLVAMRARIMWKDLPLKGPIKLAAENSKDSCSGDRSFDLFFLSSIKNQFAVWCRLHGHFSGGKLTVLQAFLNRQPDVKVKPSQRIAKSSEGLGGYPDGLNSILVGIGKTDPVECEAFVDFMTLDAKLKIPRRKTVNRIGPFRLSHERLYFEKRDGTTATVEFLKPGGSIESESIVKIAPTIGCFEDACGLILKKIRPILKSK